MQDASTAHRNISWGRRWAMQYGQLFLMYRVKANRVTFLVIDENLSVTLSDFPSHWAGQYLTAVVRKIEADTVRARLARLPLM